MKKKLIWILIPFAVAVAIPLLLIILLLLCFPVKYKIFAKIDEKKHVKVKISYLFGAVRYIYSVEGTKTEMNLWFLFYKFKGGSVQKAMEKKPKKDSDKTFNIHSFLSKNTEKDTKTSDKPPSGILTNLKDILTSSDFKTIIKDSLKLIKKIFMAVRPKHMRVNAEFGLTSPADTALIYGGYEAAACYFGISNIQLQPIFNVESNVLRLLADVDGRINIYRLIVPLVSFLLKKPIRDLILKGA